MSTPTEDVVSSIGDACSTRQEKISPQVSACYVSAYLVSHYGQVKNENPLARKTTNLTIITCPVTSTQDGDSFIDIIMDICLHPPLLEKLLANY